MSIKLDYHCYPITKKKKSSGGYDLKILKHDLTSVAASKIAHESGIYLYCRSERGGGWNADYVGKNFTDKLLNESLLKTTILVNDILPRNGNHKILYIVCKRPQGMSDETFKERIVVLEKYLITILRIRGHRLVNVQHMKSKPYFNFDLIKKNHNGQSTFKNLVHDKKMMWL
jgi:hypothetical protein